jgi:hypothetical protein
VIRRSFALLTLTTIVAACAQVDDSPTAAAVPTDASALGITTFAQRLEVARDDQRGLDTGLLELSGSIPDFGGMYLEGDTLVVWTRNQSPDARHVILTELQSRYRAVTGSTLPTDIKFLQADFSFVDLSYWKAEVARRSSASWLTVLDIDDRKNRILVGVALTALLPDAMKHLANAGVPLGAVDLQIAGSVHAEVTAQPTVRDFTFQPRGGYLIQRTPNDMECTLGANARHRTTGAWYFLTASHCSSLMGALDGGRIYQPNANNSQIGEEAYDEPWWFGTSPNGGYACAYAEGCKLADVSIYRYVSRVPDLRVARPLPNSLVLDGAEYWLQAGLNGSRKNPGTPVTKIGAAGGRRDGSITHRCADVSYIDATDNNRRRYLRCVDMANYVSSPGDSGGPVLIPAIADPGAVGIFGVHAGRIHIGSATYSVYSPGINVRGAFSLVVGDMYWCWTLQC